MSSGKLDGGCLAWTVVASSFMVNFLWGGFRFSTMFHLRSQKNYLPPPWPAYWGYDIKSQLHCFWLFFFLQNVASFSLSFGVLLPVIADHFKVGRAEAALISSFILLLTLGSGRHICAMKSLSFHPFWFLASSLSCIEHMLHILHHLSFIRGWFSHWSRPSQDHWLQPC